MRASTPRYAKVFVAFALIWVIFEFTSSCQSEGYKRVKIGGVIDLGDSRTQSEE